MHASEVLVRKSIICSEQDKLLYTACGACTNIWRICCAILRRHVKVQAGVSVEAQVCCIRVSIRSAHVCVQGGVFSHQGRHVRAAYLVHTAARFLTTLICVHMGDAQGPMALNLVLQLLPRAASGYRGSHYDA